MRDEKRRRLEAKGWKVGSAEKFLGLSPDEAAFVQLKLCLATGLRQSRVRGNITQVQLAKSVGSSQSRVAKMEAGDPTVSMDLLVRSLLTLGATPLELGRMLSGAKSATRAFKPAAATATRIRTLRKGSQRTVAART